LKKTIGDSNNEKTNIDFRSLVFFLFSGRTNFRARERQTLSIGFFCLCGKEVLNGEENQSAIKRIFLCLIALSGFGCHNIGRDLYSDPGEREHSAFSTPSLSAAEFPAFLEGETESAFQIRKPEYLFSYKDSDGNREEKSCNPYSFPCQAVILTNKAGRKGFNQEFLSRNEAWIASDIDFTRYNLICVQLLARGNRHDTEIEKSLSAIIFLRSK